MVQPDTIVARATPPGLGALAVVRISGPGSLTILETLSARAVGSPPFEDRRATLCNLVAPDTSRPIDQALVTVFRGPESYTGEDVVEISTHGGYLIPAEVLRACVTLGAREAAPGEFTQRAFLNGKVDLTQAEAVADLTRATAPRTAQAALHQLDRGLGRRISNLREGLVSLQAHLVQHLDFPEEDEAPLSLERVASEARHMASGMSVLLATAPAGELLREGALTVLAGPPNSGKSSLFNALVGRERAIVTEEAGTTRDALEATVAIDDFPFRLVDTAGLRTDPGRVERLGIEVAHRYLAQADLVLYCRAGQEALDERDRAFLDTLTAPSITARTKSDLGPPALSEGGVTVSALSGDGVPELRSRMVSLAFRGLVEQRGDVPVVTSRRHSGLVARALREVEGFADALDGGVPAEVASAHLKDAESALEEVLGLITSDEILDRVFREFCIGK